MNPWLMDGSAEGRIVTDRAPLRLSHVPRELIGTPTDSIENMVREALRTHTPFRLWLHGPPGTGKTAAARIVLERLRKGAGISGTCVNCWEHPSLYSVLDYVIRDLRVLRAEERRTAARLERLDQHLKGQPFLLVLDEIDAPPTRDAAEILYTFCSRTNFLVIAIAGDTLLLTKMEPRVISRINPRVMEFPRYSAQQIGAILQDRALSALSPGSWNGRIISDIASGVGGDARRAIQALHDAAAAAQADGAMRIMRKYIRKAWQASELECIERRLALLTKHHRMLCEIVRQEGEIVATSLYEAYLEQCAVKNLRPIARRTFSQYLQRLACSHLVLLERAPIRGRHNLVRCTEPGASPDHGAIRHPQAANSRSLAALPAAGHAPSS